MNDRVECILKATAEIREGGPLPKDAEQLLRQFVAKSSSEPEDFAEDDLRLPLIERIAILAMRGLWRQLRDRVLALLGLNGPIEELFTFDPNDLVQLIVDGDLFAAAAAAPSGPLTNAQVASWTRGARNGAADLKLEWNSDAVRGAIDRQLARIREHYAQSGLQLVRSGIVRGYRPQIVAALQAGEFDGQNPVHIARELKKRFDAGEYNWERLARSEVTYAQASGKRALYQSQGVEEYDYVTAGDAKVSARCRELAAAGPYKVADPKSPLPMRDSHPNCRCSIRAVPPK